MPDLFADIRPYRDEEVADVLGRLLHNKDLLDALAKLRFEKLSRVVPGLGRLLVRWYLGRQMRNVRDIYGMQMVVKSYVEQVIEDSTGGLSVSGLENLDPKRPYLFISNHRDIAMDPAFTNYALHQGGHETVRIAIGDNLLTEPWVSDVMRLNKCFIVTRSVSGPRELLAASKKLANYIRFSLHQENAPAWIAQREGRAKDGIDKTEPAVIKMLGMSREKATESFGDHIASLAIVPVAISYELDPCDALKANEMHQMADTGAYEKGEQEDIASIGHGIAGAKGRVHVSFGKPLNADAQNALEAAQLIDRQIIDNYCLHPTNLYAYEMLYGEHAPAPKDLYLEEGDFSREQFEARINALPEEHRPYALAIYANAVVSKMDQADTVPGAV